MNTLLPLSCFWLVFERQKMVSPFDFCDDFCNQVFQLLLGFCLFIAVS